MEKVIINGEELAIKFNLATELAYEELTGKIFNAADIFVEKDKINTKALLFSAIGCVIANNPESKIDGDYILKNATREETSNLAAAATKALIEWLNIPAMAEKHVKKPKKDKQPKNS